MLFSWLRSCKKLFLSKPEQILNYAKLVTYPEFIVVEVSVQKLDDVFMIEVVQNLNLHGEVWKLFLILKEIKNLINFLAYFSSVFRMRR